MSNLNNMTIENENKFEIIEESYVYIVKDKNSTITVFASFDAAETYILRKIGELKDNFLTSRYRFDVVSDMFNYTIKCSTWFLGLIYYEYVLDSFQIEQQVIRS